MWIYTGNIVSWSLKRIQPERQKMFIYFLDVEGLTYLLF